MTDPDEGFFSHLDDPAAPMPGRDALDGVVRRGRQLRARRRTAWAVTGAAGVTAAIVGGLGISQALDTNTANDRVVGPLQTPSPSTSATNEPRHKKHSDGGTTVVPGGVQPGIGHPRTSPPTSTEPTPVDECASPSASPEAPEDPLSEPSIPPLVPTPSPTCVPGSASPSPTESVTPTDSPQPSVSPS